MNRRDLLVGTLGAALALGLCLASQAQAENAGAITGTIKFDGPPPKMKKIKMGSEASCDKMHEDKKEEPREETFVVNADGTLKNVLIYIKSGPAVDNYKGTPPTTPVSIDQHGCQYTPHVMGIQVGQPFQIKNSDMGVLHNIHAISLAKNRGNEFNKGMRGDKDQPDVIQKFSDPEVCVKVKCDVHGWMVSWVGVFTHPYFSVSDDKGKFSIKDLPEGDYEVVAWHEKAESQTQKIHVGKAPADVTFTFKAP